MRSFRARRVVYDETRGPGGPLVRLTIVGVGDSGVVVVMDDSTALALATVVSARDGGATMSREYDQDGGLIDGVGFAEPGGRSALRAATKRNPRNRPCPTCGAENRLTPKDVARHYQCDDCADRAEGGGY